MAIQLTDIDEGDTIAPEFERTRVGCLVISDDGSWKAACPGAQLRTEGTGPFDNLPPGILWMVNQDYRTVRALQEANPEVRLCLSGWMRIALEDMPREWGIDNISGMVNAETVASIFDRVLRVSSEAALKSEMSYVKSEADLFNQIEQSPSLATGIRKVFNKQMDATVPKDQQVRKRVTEALSYGVSRVQDRNLEEGEFTLHCRIPRLTHALRVTDHDVPSAGKWQKAELDTSKPLESHLRDLKSLDRPVMVIANPKDRQSVGHDYYSGWVRPNTKAIKKMSYTLEETEVLLKHFSFEDYSVIVGPGWKKSATGKMIGALVQVAGGRNVGASSWSVNVAAENILCGGFRKLNGTESLSPECVWLTAQDRLAMVPAVEHLLDCGAILVSAYAGGIVVKVPQDPEIITLAAHAVWDGGLQFPIGTVRELMALGIEPPFESEAFGGAREDLILGQLTHRGQRNALWRFDEIIDLPIEHRAAAFAALLG